MPSVGMRQTPMRGMFGGAKKPDAPTSVIATPTNTGASIAFTAPVFNGGLPITNYQYSQDDGTNWVTRSPASTASPVVVSGLANGTPYTFRVRAVNALGPGDQSNSSAATPRNVPDAPVSSSSSSGNGTYTFSWTAPANNGAAITSYTVQLTDANQTVWDAGKIVTNVTALTYTFTGLSNGYSYRARVLAINAAGSSGYGESVAQTPSTIPDNVGTPSSSAGDRSFTISWSAPGNGGTAITTYWVQYSTDNVNWSTAEDVGNVLTKTWSGDGTNFRNNGTTYYGRVLAFNARGNSVAWSAGSTGRVPAFQASGTISAVSETTAAPIYNEDGAGATYGGAGHAGYRVMNVSFDPPDVSAFSYCFIQAHNDATSSFGNCQDDTPNTPIFYSNGGQAYGFYYFQDQSYYGLSLRFNPGYNYTFRLVTYNTDGDYVVSSETSAVAAASIGYYTYDGSQQTDTSGTSVINANTYTNNVNSAERGTETKTYSVTCYAASTTGTATICTTSRYFVSQWSASTSYSGFTNYTGLQAPWSTNSGTTYRSASIGATSPYGSGLRIRVIGNGSIGSGWSPTISVYYVIKYRNRYYNTW